MKQKLELDISIMTIIKVIIVLLAFYLIFLVRDVLAILFVTFIFVSAAKPIVDKWEKKLGRLASVIILLAIFLSLTSVAIWIIFPPFVHQGRQLIGALPGYLEQYPVLSSYRSYVSQGLNSISNNIGNITGSFLNLTAGVFGAFFALLTALVLSVYLLLDKNGLEKFSKSILPENKRPGIVILFHKISDMLGRWMGGQLVLGLIVGAIDLIGLYLIGIPYAITLAVISAILEIVPTVGPIIAGILAVIAALTTGSALDAILVAILYIVVQQLENSIIVPKVMQKALGLSPVIIIIAVLVGGKLFGILGALLAVPLAALISVIIQEWPTVVATFTKNE